MSQTRLVSVRPPENRMVLVALLMVVPSWFPRRATLLAVIVLTLLCAAVLIAVILLERRQARTQTLHQTAAAVLESGCSQLTAAATAAVVWAARHNDYRPSHIRLISLLNSIDHEELLWCNGEHPDPEFRYTDKQHIIGGVLNFLEQLGHPVSWDSQARKYMFKNPESYSNRDKNVKMDAALDSYGIK